MGVGVPLLYVRKKKSKYELSGGFGSGLLQNRYTCNVKTLPG